MGALGARRRSTGESCEMKAQQGAAAPSPGDGNNGSDGDGPGRREPERPYNGCADDDRHTENSGPVRRALSVEGDPLSWLPGRSWSVSQAIHGLCSALAMALGNWVRVGTPGPGFIPQRTWRLKARARPVWFRERRIPKAERYPSTSPTGRRIARLNVAFDGGRKKRVSRRGPSRAWWSANIRQRGSLRAPNGCADLRGRSIRARETLDRPCCRLRAWMDEC